MPDPHNSPAVPAREPVWRCEPPDRQPTQITDRDEAPAPARCEPGQVAGMARRAAAETDAHLCATCGHLQSEHHPCGPCEHGCTGCERPATRTPTARDNR